MTAHFEKPAGLIAAPGIYDLTNREYHGQCCDGPSISASGIKTIVSESPADFWRTSKLNSDAEPAPDKQAFRFGEAAHTLLLEPERVKDQIDVIPLDILASNGATSTGAAKEFIAESIRNGRTPIKPSEWLEVERMRDALAAHPFARRALQNGRAEVSLIMQDPQTDVWLKSRPDFMPDGDGKYIVDYKTTAKNLRDWEKAATVDLRYDIQAALMLWAANVVANVEPKGILYLVQEKKAPYRVGMLAFTIDVNKPATRALLDCARLDLRHGIDTFRNCYDANDWPSGWELPREIEAPGWHQKSAEYRCENASYDFGNEYSV